MDGPHHTGIRELDLSNWHANAVADKLNHAVPAIRSSAAFLSFLRANLVLDSTAVSHANTPLLQPTFHRTQPAQPALSDTESLPDFDDIPDLSLEILAAPEEKKQALDLVADSIAEQRTDVAWSIVLHPVSIVGLITSLAVVHHQTRPLRQHLGVVLPILIVAAFLATYLAIVHHLTAPYTRLASSMSFAFLRPDMDPIRPGSRSASASMIPDHRSDLVLAARSDVGEIVSVVVLRLEPKQPIGIAGLAPGGPPAGPKKRSKGSSGNAGPLRGGKGVIRAWTTTRAWRQRSVGTDLLREAVRVTRERCGKDAEVGFAREHANSNMVLPEMFNSAFRRRERCAALTLDRVVGEWEVARKRR
ncbi:acetyltransferase [Plectosphaerella plurivora]|uniref:Acetyltransferase n=1 Tax=Plectosphaerella plurivora TaxID=936078 RepID=A0A9P8V4D7_9PEZI|nr:acetyltransferase [Plectosphaerella plurivora]